jgi:hypothetical protein
VLRTRLPRGKLSTVTPCFGQFGDGCARFVTHFSDLPERSVPRFVSHMARSTVIEASRSEAAGFFLSVGKVPSGTSNGEVLPALDTRAVAVLRPGGPSSP